MELKLKLFSSLMEHLPDEAVGNTVKVVTTVPKSCNDLVARYKIPPESVQVVMVNGEHVSSESRDDPLRDGDTISIWPSIQGG